MFEKEHARGVLNFLKWVEESLAREDIKTHVKILVQSYIAKLHDEGKLGKPVYTREEAELIKTRLRNLGFIE